MKNKYHIFFTGNPFSVELKGGSASVALTAQLEAWNEKDLEAYNDRHNLFVLPPSFFL